MKRFEYKTIEFHLKNSVSLFKWLTGFFILHETNIDNTDEINRQLNFLGQQGWELVSTTQKISNGSTTVVIAFLKREI